jgi:transcriptional regulator with XRE-family HTH domain
MTDTRVGPAGDIARWNIRRLRETRGHSLRVLSEKLKANGRPVSPDAILKVEQGLRRVDVDDLVAFADVFGVTVAQLLDPPTDCTTCHGAPPPGFACRECGVEA